MADYRYIIKTDDGRYVQSGTTSPTQFTKIVWAAKFYKNEDDAKRVIAGGRRFLEKYGKAAGSNWPSDFKVVKVEIKEQ